jgi:hypothetical protein
VETDAEKEAIIADTEEEQGGTPSTSDTEDYDFMSLSSSNLPQTSTTEPLDASAVSFVTQEQSTELKNDEKDVIHQNIPSTANSVDVSPIGSSALDGEHDHTTTFFESSRGLPYVLEGAQPASFMGTEDSAQSRSTGIPSPEVSIVTDDSAPMLPTEVPPTMDTGKERESSTLPTSGSAGYGVESLSSSDLLQPSLVKALASDLDARSEQWEGMNYDREGADANLHSNAVLRDVGIGAEISPIGAERDMQESVSTDDTSTPTSSAEPPRVRKDTMSVLLQNNSAALRESVASSSASIASSSSKKSLALRAKDLKRKAEPKPLKKKKAKKTKPEKPTKPSILSGKRLISAGVN